MLRSTVKLRFSQLYMECSTRRSEFFQKVNHLDSLGRNGKKIRKIYQKRQGIKG
ncbi:MAG: hypothetical protein ACMUEL_02355 [Flavobacteriales bacterium Tduv]